MAKPRKLSTCRVTSSSLEWQNSEECHFAELECQKRVTVDDFNWKIVNTFSSTYRLKTSHARRNAACRLYQHTATLTLWFKFWLSRLDDLNNDKIVNFAFLTRCSNLAKRQYSEFAILMSCFIKMTIFQIMSLQQDAGSWQNGNFFQFCHCD